MTQLKTTPLNTVHRALRARMVDFGGWEMPVNYGSQVDEHHAVRSDAGMFDVSHMCILDITGTSARAFLRIALANNVDKLKTPGRGLYSCMLNESGGVIDDLIVYYFADEMFRIVVNASTADKDISWLSRLNAQGSFGVTLMPRDDLAILAVQGQNAGEKVWRAIPTAQQLGASLNYFHAIHVKNTPFGTLMIARTGYTGENGFELIVESSHITVLWKTLLAHGVRPCGLGARDTLRLEAGMNLYGQDMDENVSPLDAGLAWTVDFSENRDFVGSAALRAKGQRAAFMGLLLHKNPQGNPAGILRAHQKILTAHGNGEITSGTFSPSLQQSIAFARVPTNVSVGDTVQVVIRDKLLPARMVTLPFVRYGKPLI
ncbi:glycine cleavage system aminomethyltransferase GcvT [Candidatus Vallotia cooleyia]|uniref:glycine cleavage system aminomethyltransferase GcvT n=1 Tax=Candidatus Vallotiella adelgis TaxID=1177211 RepID=UPI001D01269E|nr:glycine cleavage system aminomethyltransferase GcvT [Candidatus Vallotia cooleyia]UDG81827.1 Aminomethyltransferase [Candidatus Vallotia cooleyia]